ncbi:MAG TPA: hypothetical protein PK986_11575, partial [Spirochaetota bacterium]|nr:hypothetical protein [Spirochaetota bacterium]
RLLSVIQNMTLTCVENMNACIYLNEKMMLLTSAGIDRISFQSDINTAVTFSAGDDCKIYNAIKTSIEKASLQGIKIMLQPGSDMQIISADKMYRGFCILCRMPVTFNASKPLCSMCSRTCDQAAINPGQFCHSCGTEVKVTMKDPLCGKCHIY